MLADYFVKTDVENDFLSATVKVSTKMIRHPSPNVVVFNQYHRMLCFMDACMLENFL